MKCESPAVVLKPNQDSTLLAVGHAGGALSIYDLKDKSEEASPDPEVTFEGHTSKLYNYKLLLHNYCVVYVVKLLCFLYIYRIKLNYLVCR